MAKQKALERRVAIKTYVKAIFNEAKTSEIFGYSLLGITSPAERIVFDLYSWTTGPFLLSKGTYTTLSNAGINFSASSHDTDILYDICRKCLGYECDSLSFYDN